MELLSAGGCATDCAATTWVRVAAAVALLCAARPETDSPARKNDDLDGSGGSVGGVVESQCQVQVSLLLCCLAQHPVFRSLRAPRNQDVGFVQ